jgi:shikimate kinase
MITLIGPGGAGKSRVGALLAERLGMTFVDLDQSEPSVVAVSSGFMTYPPDIHSDYVRLRCRIERSPTTFVLIPSLDREICAAETVRRQLARPFARSAAAEEAVIRHRFPIYAGLRARKIETMRPLAAIVHELVAAIRGEA